MQRIEGGCHCGTIRYEFLWPLDAAEIPVRACSCSFCLKHRGTYTSHPQAELHATLTNTARVPTYRFGHETADFYVCARCGVLTFAVSRIAGRGEGARGKLPQRKSAVVNVHTFERIDPANFTARVTNFDGETPESRLARRQRTWTPTVRITHTRKEESTQF